MLLEVINYTATMLVRRFENPGFVRASVDLWSRARRCRKDWAAHEAHSKAFVRSAMAALPQRRTVVVLGSGLLRDVPVDDLAQNFRSVILVDLVHLASVQFYCRVRGYSNVTFVTRDISGFDPVGPCNPKPLQFLENMADVDLVISANVLSQIGIGAESQLLSAAKPLTRTLLAGLITAHIEGLQTLACKTCLITDIGWQERAGDGTVREEGDLMYGIVLPDPEESWPWPVVPFGEISRDFEVVHRVIATTRLLQSPAASLN
jgi:hypothetical protein